MLPPSWAKSLAETMGSGDDYTALRRCISILWFRRPVLKTQRFHSRLQLVEDATAERQARLKRWARFLNARTAEELEGLAREDETMKAAKNALAKLSLNSRAKRLAQERERQVVTHRHLIGSSFIAGKAKGRAEGHLEGLLVAIKTACSLLGIELDDQRTVQLSQLNVTELERLVQRLKIEKRWPDDLG